MEKIYTNECIKMYNYCLLWFVINVQDDIMIKTEMKITENFALYFGGFEVENFNM